MMLRLLCPRILPAVSFQQIRNLRPTIKIGREKFEITLNVHQFLKEEIRVKARPEYVCIEGKQERETKRGYIIRQFTRKFRLPKGCNPQAIRSELSPDGTLTITAPREHCEINLPCEMAVPISLTDKKPEDQSIVEVQKEKLSTTDYCKKMIEDCKKKNDVK
ncbi:protein lethal(2)essential for life-like [Leguminivora glycinivorella]|uniref:protein lethal(2)essential for life-like n=1 Tax=Leguminivora glycinivorella TaxID=1035111 RepID=UPI00200C8993|nr:protein lethal(2)essential for life-like [Leguminivora glycinivorella]